MPTSPPEFSSLNVGPINFSARRPAIIVPVVATTIQASLDAIQDILLSPHANQIEVIEWRVDHVLRSEEHTSELQSRGHLVCRLLLEKKKESRKDDIQRDEQNHARRIETTWNSDR